jgi:putative IMPACT (imprinted ancient) family translation regulator
MPWYIQRRESSRSLETIDEIDDAKEAHRVAKEYNISDPTAVHYVSKVPCKAWRNEE